jgi:CBS domain-containing protein
VLFNDASAEAGDYVRSHGARAGDVMTRVVVSVKPTTSAGDIASLMEKWNIKRVPVVRAGKLVGIVSRSDLIRVVRDAKPAGNKTRISDQALRERLRKQLAREDWVDSALVNFVVDKGQVEIFGVAPSKVQRDAIRVMAENVRGVQAVKDGMSVVAQRVYVA